MSLFIKIAKIITIFAICNIHTLFLKTLFISVYIHVFTYSKQKCRIVGHGLGEPFPCFSSSARRAHPALKRKDVSRKIGALVVLVCECYSENPHSSKHMHNFSIGNTRKTRAFGLFVQECYSENPHSNKHMHSF